MSKSEVAQAQKTTNPDVGSRERYEAWQAEQERIAKARATGSPEVVALRELVRMVEHECEGFAHRAMTPIEILSEAIRCAQSDFAVIGDSSCSGSGIADSMVFRRAELRLDLALALAEFRAEFPVTGDEEAKAAE